MRYEVGQKLVVIEGLEVGETYHGFHFCGLMANFIAKEMSEKGFFVVTSTSSVGDSVYSLNVEGSSLFFPPEIFVPFDGDNTLPFSTVINLLDKNGGNYAVKKYEESYMRDKRIYIENGEIHFEEKGVTRWLQEKRLGLPLDGWEIVNEKV